MTIVLPGRPPTANAFLQSFAVHNWRNMTHPIRDAAAWLAKSKKPHWPAPPLSISYRGRYANSRSLPDPGGLALAAKAAIDGLVDAGMLEDDTWEHITRLEELPPVIVPGVDEALILTIESEAV